MSHYAIANATIQNFQAKWGGSVMKPNVVVIHTTEGTGWEDYQGGAVAPNYTAHPFIKAKRIDWRCHFQDECSSRALVNAPGGVETNGLNCVQVELVGTCDPKHKDMWGSLKAGVDYIYWPDAPDWALNEVAKFIADQHKRHGLKLQAPTFLPYPASFGANGVRFTGKAWENFYGVCGHQHVPENDHGDPGNINIARIFELAKAIINPPAPTPTPAPTPPPAPVPAPKPTFEPAKAPKVKLGHPNKALGQTEAFGDSDRGLRYFAKKGCTWVDGNALPDSQGRLANTHWQSFLRHGFTTRDGSRINRDLTVNHYTTADLHAKFWTRRGHYVIDSIDNRIRLAWSLGMDYELELKATASRAELQRLHDLFGHDPKRKVIVKTLLQRPGDPVGDLKPAHEVGFPTLLTNHRPFAKAPAAAKAWIDEWRRFQPRWV